MTEMTTSEMRAVDGGRWRCSCGRTYWLWISAMGHLGQANQYNMFGKNRHTVNWVWW